MKIGFVGKGGSGKSSMSWLFSHVLAQSGTPVLAIDADHNMDLTSNLGVDDSDLPSMFSTHDAFRQMVGIDDGDKWSEKMCAEDSRKILFTVSPPDFYTESLCTPAAENINLINVGLGSEEALYMTRCAHGSSAPLKYYLPFLDEGDSAVIVDGVAGTDMLNFGLYAGIDALVCVVEPHRNSVKVFELIKSVAERTNIPVFAILNKPSTNEFHAQMREKYTDLIVGEIPLDVAIQDLTPESLSSATRTAVHEIWKRIGDTIPETDHLERLRAITALKS